MKHKMMHRRGSGLISLRNLPAELERAIRERARTRGLSLNRAVISLLEEALGLESKGPKRPIYTDLDSLAGTWTQEQAKEFDRSLAEQRNIDRELWK